MRFPASIVVFLTLSIYTQAFSLSKMKHQERIVKSTVSFPTFSTKLSMFFAEEEEKEEEISPSPMNTNSDDTVGSTTTSKPSMEPASVDLIASDDEKFLNMLGSFLVDSFWLNSEHHQLGDTSSISQEARMGLIVEQCGDLQEKYGETMGKRLFDACAFAALDNETKTIVGAATLKASLLMNGQILEPEKAEAMAKNAVASLGPKQRRLYKDAPIATIATELMSPDTKAVCVLANLAISPDFRGRGIALTLCEEAEGLAGDWGYDEIHLVVEKDNAAARGLYEGRLGYKFIAEEKNAEALRADMANGEFKEVQVDTLVLGKSL